MEHHGAPRVFYKGIFIRRIIVYPFVGLKTYRPRVDNNGQPWIVFLNHTRMTLAKKLYFLNSTYICQPNDLNYLFENQNVSTYFK